MAARRYVVEVDGLPVDVPDSTVRGALAAAVEGVHRASSARTSGLSVGTSGGLVEGED